MRFEVLGTLQISYGSAAYLPSAPKQRQLLALLLLNANKPVSLKTCMTELWEDDPPRTSAQTVQTYVLQIRRALAAVPALGSLVAARKYLATTPRGYAMHATSADYFDLELFRGLVGKARAALASKDDVLVSSICRQALETWRGRALSDVDCGPILQAQVLSLEEQLVAVAEDCYDAELRLGRHHELLSELSTAAAQHPMNENMQALHMLALYRSGRQAQALEVFHRLRTTLVEQLGLTPSTKIALLHDRILRLDPALDYTGPDRSSVASDLARSS